EIRSDLRYQLVAGDPHRGGEPGAYPDAVFDPPGDRGGFAEQRSALRDIEVRLVEGEALDERRDLVEHAEDFPGDLTVTLHARRDADCCGTKAQCRVHRHGGPYTEFTHFVVGRGDHSAPAGPADDHRFA